MRLLWTLLKVVIVLALVIPASIIVLGMVLGLFGALLGLAIMALRIAVVGLIGYGVIRLGMRLFRGRRPTPRPRAEPIKELPPVDPYYNAAMRELDRELGEPAR